MFLRETTAQPTSIAQRRRITSPQGHQTVTKLPFRQRRGPSSIADAGCSAPGIVTPADAAALGLPNLGPARVNIVDANGGVSRASNETLIQTNDSTGTADRAVVGPVARSLEGIGKYTDQGYVVVYHDGFNGVSVHPKTDVNIDWTNEPIRTGWRDKQDGLWHWSLKAPPPKTVSDWLLHTAPRIDPTTLMSMPGDISVLANNVYELPSIKSAVRFMHAVCGYPVKSTWMKAIRNNHYVGWPMLTIANVEKHFPETVETPRGHLNQLPAGIRSTKRSPLPESKQQDLKAAVNKKENDIFVRVWEMKHTVYSDQTGKFPVRSKAGNQYQMIMVHVDSNAVLAEPMKNRTDGEMTRAYLCLLDRLKTAGFVVKKHILDNECSAELKRLIKETCKLQLVPPGNHRANLAEVAIKAFKQHFLSILAGTAPDFPWSAWDHLLPQVLITLNLLRASHATPTISAHAHLCGHHDYNAMPLLPIGASAEIHVKTGDRKSWDFHSQPGWYLYTSEDHYRTHAFLMKNSRSIRLSDTAVLQKDHIVNPTVTAADAIVHATAKLAAAAGLLTKRTKTDPDMNDLRSMAEIVQSMAERNQIQATTPVPVPRVPDNLRDSDPTSRPLTRARARELTPVPPDSTVPPCIDTTAIHRPRVIATPNTSARAAPTTTPIPQTQASHAPPPPRVPSPVPATATQAIREAQARVANKQVPPGEPVATRTRSKAPATTETATTMPTQSTAADPVASRTRSQTADALALALGAAAEFGNANISASRLASRRFPSAIFETASALAVMCPTTGDLLKYRQLIHHKDPEVAATWTHSSANEFGRLFQGVGGRIKAPTNTCTFIHRHQVPDDRFKDVQYGKFECSWRPQKIDEPNRTRLTIGWRGHYPYDVGTPTAEMLLVKILFNSIVSTPGAEFMTTDISDFYLATPLKRKEYLRLSLRDIPEEIINEYNLHDKAINGHVYVEVGKGMYGLPQSGLLANELLETRLAKFGYRQSKLVPGLWKHDWRPVTFTLVVDDFGVKYVGKEHAEHLESAITQSGYRIKSDWSGTKYIGITLDWDYDRREVHLSMPGYNKKGLTRFQHKTPTKRQDSPYEHARPNYGAKEQYAPEEDSTAPLNADDKKTIQQINGTYLFSARAIDSPLLVTLGSLTSEQANPTEKTKSKAQRLLDFISTQEDPVLTYRASAMILAAHSDASYLSEPKARSRAGGHIFLSENVEDPPNNGAILTVAQIIKNVMSSATEAELAALYIVAKECVYIRLVLEEMGHKQPATPIQTDNSTAEGVINNKIEPKRTKAMDMRFHWLRDRETLKQFRIFWRAGIFNLADYFTKHHCAAHHKRIRPTYLTSQQALNEARTRIAARQQITPQ